MRHVVDPVPASTRAIPREKPRQEPKRGEKVEWKATGKAPAGSLGLPDEGDVPVVRVRATQQGYYGWMTRYPGDVFDIALAPKHDKDVVAKKSGQVIYRAGDPTAFSPFWMERVAGDTPTRITTAPEDLARRNESMIANGRGVTGDADVI